MPQVTKHTQGMLCWADCSTKDPVANKQFYSSLFGWTQQDDPMGDGQVYTRFQKNGLDVCAASGQMKEEAAAGVPPHWNVYIAVDDVDKIAPRASQNGGKIVMGPFDVFDAGRMAFVQDPTGGVLGLWQAKKHIGAQVNMESNTLCWAELMTSNVDAAGKYYINLLGWQAENVPQMSYTLFKVAGQNASGMMALPPPMARMPSHWMIYFAVDSCDETVKKVASLGGKVLAPATDIPTIGRFAVFQDPQGAAFAVIQPAPR